LEKKERKGGKEKDLRDIGMGEGGIGEVGLWEGLDMGEEGRLGEGTPRNFFQRPPSS
jgi:hypothetical protein